MNEICLLCSQDIDHQVSIFNYFFQKDLLCGNCRKQLEVFHQYVVKRGVKILALYLYNDFVENMLFQFKEGRDVALKHTFLYLYKKEIKDKFRHYTIVYMPSFKKKNEERGFFALEEMLEEIELPKISVFEKKKTYKQSLQPYEKRNKVKEVLTLKKGYSLPKTPLLLFDDMLTSGNTLLHAYSLIQEHPYDIQACVCCIHPLFVETCDVFSFKK